MKISEEKGMSVIGTPIVTAISMFLIALLLIAVVNILMPFIWYEKLALESLKYIFVMEEYGYLTASEKERMVNELSVEHFDPANLDITATDEPVEYGEPIFLNISYNYQYRIPFLTGSSLSTENRDMSIQMTVRRQSVSKR